MSAISHSPDTAATLRAVLGALAVPAVAVDDAGRVLAANAAASARLSVALAVATGRPAGDVVAGLDECVRLPLDVDALGGALLVWPLPTGMDATAIELQKADTLGRLAGGISHDLANPLGAILTLASMIASEPGVPEDLQGPAGLLRDEADRTLRLIRSTLEFARRRPAAKTHVALGPLVRECLELCASATASLDVRMTVSEVMPELESDAGKLRQAILAVLLAAVEAMGGIWTQRGPTATGRLRIGGYLAETGGRYCARLAIDDTGPVDPLRERATLLDGVALNANRDVAVAAALVDELGGRLDYESLADGNRIVLELPLAGDAPLPRRARLGAQSAGSATAGSSPTTDDRLREPGATAHDRASVTTPPGAPSASAGSTTPPLTARAGSSGTGDVLTVLVCDDERSIRELLGRVITRAGHRAREASGGAEALAILDGDRVDLVIADQRMADMTGVDLYRAAVARRPELATRFVLMSGDAGTAELLEFASATGLQVIEKPFDLSVVTATLRRLAAG